MKNYEIVVASNGKISIPHFVEVGQQLREFGNLGHTNSMAILRTYLISFRCKNMLKIIIKRYILYWCLYFTSCTKRLFGEPLFEIAVKIEFELHVWWTDAEHN